MDIVDKLAEARIQEAIDRGDFDDLAGAGEPVPLDDNTFVPEHLRAAYRLLKNAGFLPQELVLHKEIQEVEQLLAQIPDKAGRNKAQARLDLLRLQLESQRGRASNLQHEACYQQKLLENLQRKDSES